MIAALALATLGGTAHAASDLVSNPPKTTSICLDVSGQTLPAVCRAPASRLDMREDICQCPEGTRVEVSVCAKGQRPPPEGIKLYKARRVAAKGGTLVGARFEGKPMCVAPREP